MARDDERTYHEWHGWRIHLVSKQRGYYVKAQCLAQPDKWVDSLKLYPFGHVALEAIQRIIREAETAK